MNLTFEIPLPPKDCSPNRASHQHFRHRSTATKEYRKAVWAIAKEAMPAVYVPVPVRIHHEWYMGQSKTETSLRAAYLASGGKKKLPSEFYRPRDKQNAIAALKAAIDGIVDARIIPDDNDEWLDWGQCTFYRKPEQHGGRSCVVITLEAL